MTNHVFIVRVLLTLCIASLLAASSLAGPQGEQVVAGNATFERSGADTTITASNNAIINYDSFNIGAAESVRFIQPDAASRVLNRVNDASMTRIDGSLTANGHVYILNPAGVFFGGSAVVNVGSLTAVGGNMNNDDFLAGVDKFQLTGAAVNHGLINGHDVRMLGSRAINHGTINSDDGLVLMAAGEEVYLVDGDSPVFARVTDDDPEAQSAGGAVQQRGAINAGDGAVQFAAGDHYAVAVHHAGQTRAREVYVNAPARQVNIAGNIWASDTTLGTGGDVTIVGKQIVMADADIDASGADGGGSVRIGGDLRGEGELDTSEYTLIASDVDIRADAGDQGDGGTIVVWADRTTVFDGNASARGGANGGDGGFIEISGANALVQNGSYDLAAPQGAGGTLLFDPLDIIIRPGIGDGNDDNAFQNGFSEREELVTDGGGFGAINFTNYENFASFVVYESEIEGEFVTPGGNIVLEARRSIRAEGVFDEPIEVDTNVLDNDLRPPPNGIGLTLRTRNTDADGAGVIDLEAATFAVANGATLTIEGSTSGEQAANITLGGLTADGGAINVTTENGNVAMTGDIINDNGVVNVSTDTGTLAMGSAGSITTQVGAVTLTAPTSINIGGSITTDGAAVNITSDGNIVFTSDNGDITTDGGAINVLADNDGDDVGLLTMHGGSVFDAGAGNITLNAGQDILLGSLVTTGDVAVTSTAGAILDANAAASNVMAANVALNSFGGLGSITDLINAQGDPLEITATNAITALTATNAGSDIFVDIGASPLPANPIIVGGAGVGSAILALDGDVDISGGVGGLFTLTAGDSYGILSDGTITIPNAGLNLANATIILEGGVDIVDGAGRDLDFSADSLFFRSGNTGGPTTLNTTVVNLNAGLTGAGDLTVNETDGVTITRLQTLNSDITLMTGGDTTLGEVNAGTGDINITAGGAVADATGKIIGNNLVVDSMGQTVLDTTVSTIDASVGAAGSLTITETDGVDLLDVDTADGAISVTSAAGMLTATDVRSLTDAAANDITLTSPGGIGLGIVQAGTNGDLVLSSTSGAISDIDMVFNQDVTAATIDATARTGLILDAVTTAVNAVNTAAGDVNINSVGTLNVNGVSSSNGDVTVSATGVGADLNVNADITSGGANTLTLNAGDELIDNGGQLFANTLAGTSGGAATFDMDVDAFGYTAGGDILVNSASGFAMNHVDAGGGDVTITTLGGITDGNGAGQNITANDLSILAETTIGTITDFSEGVGDALEVAVANQVNQIEITEAGGSIFIDLGATSPAFGGVGVDPDSDGAGDAILRSSVDINAVALLPNFNITAGDRIGLDSGGTLTIPEPFNAPAGTAAVLLRGDTEIVDTVGIPNFLVINVPVLSFFSGSGVHMNRQVFTNSDEVTARLTGPGNLTLIEDVAGGDLQVNGASTVNGSLTIVTLGGSLNTMQASSNGSANVALSSSGGDLTVGDIEAAGNTIDLNANGGSILDGDGKLVASHLEADATAGMTLDSTVDTIDASTSGPGDIVVTETDDITLTDLDTNDGDIDVTAGGTTTITDVDAGTRTADIRSTTDIQGTTGGATDVNAGNIMLRAPQIGNINRVELLAANRFDAGGMNINIHSLGDLPVGYVDGGNGGTVDLLSDANLDSVADDYNPDIRGNIITMQGTFIGANSPIELLSINTVNATATDPAGTVHIDFQLGLPQNLNIVAPGGFDTELERVTNIAEQLPGGTTSTAEASRVEPLGETPQITGTASLDEADTNEGFGVPPVRQAASSPVRPVLRLGGQRPAAFERSLADAYADFNNSQANRVASLVAPDSFSVVDFVSYLKFGHSGETPQEAETRREAYNGLRDLARNLQQQDLFGLGQRQARLDALEDFRPDGITPEQFDLLVDVIGLDNSLRADASR